MLFYSLDQKVHKDVRIAQLDRASGYGPEGRGFESFCARCPGEHPGFSFSGGAMHYHKSMKKLIFPLLLSLILSLILMVGCTGKETCAYCGETKYCREYDLVGVTRLICDDCLRNPEVAGNSPAILAEYGITPKEEEPANEEETTLETDVPFEDSIDIETNSESISENNAPQEIITSVTKDGLLKSLQAYYAETNMELIVSENNKNVYMLYAGDEYQNIDFLFTPVAEGMVPPLSVQCYEGASDTGYTAACIRSALIYIGSTDYSGLGYEIYNNCVSYGSHVSGDTKFYYTAFSETDVENGAPKATFDISK